MTAAIETITTAIESAVKAILPTVRPGARFSMAPTQADLADLASSPQQRTAQVYAADVLGIGAYFSPRHQVRQLFVIAIAYDLPSGSPQWAEWWAAMAADAALVIEALTAPAFSASLPSGAELDAEAAPTWQPPPRSSKGRTVSLIRATVYYQPGA